MEAMRERDETMRGGGARLSAAEKGKQKAADVADLQLQESVVDEPGDAVGGTDSHGGGAGVVVPRHLLVPTSATSEIEEAPPSPPRTRSVLPALDADAAGPAAALQGTVNALQAALAGRLQELEQLRREREGLFKDGAGKRREGAGAGEPAVDAAAETQALEHKLGMMREAVSGARDMVLALQLQEEEILAAQESFKGWEEFWKPVAVPVPQRRRNRKIGATRNWKRIISLIACAGWLVLLFRFRIITGAVNVLLILIPSECFCRQRFRTSKGLSRHVAQLIRVCFGLLVLYVLYLIVQAIHGTFAGLLGKHQ